MDLHLAASFLAVVIATGATSAVLAAGPDQRVNRLLAVMMAGVALWGTCNVLRAFATDPEQARLLALLAAPGWLFIGPLGLDTLSEVLPQRRRWIDRILPVSYAGSGLLLLVTWFSFWVLGPARPAAAGWQSELGPGALVALAYQLAHILPAIGLALRQVGRSPSPSERNQVKWLAVGLALPVLCAPASNVVLPLLGYESARLGHLSLALFGAIVAWTSLRFGHSPLARRGFLRQILDAHPDGVALMLFSGQLATASDGLARLVGISAAELAGRSLGEFLDPSPADPPREVHDLESELRTAGGRRLPVSVSTRVLQDRRGLDFALVVVIRDLREVVALRSGLVTSGRLAAIGQLAAGIAHEINNPMAFVRSNLALLREHWDELAKAAPPEEAPQRLAGEVEELLDESLEGVERACAIVRDINGFAHAGSGARGPVDLRPLLDNVLRVASPQLRGGRAVERRYATSRPVLGAEQELKQVFLNLLVNAAHATADGGTVRLEIEPEDDAVLVHIRDDGCGIPAEAMEKIFDPFFTTKEVGEGTGMGLFISYRIVRNHGGTIRVDSEPGRGTHVRVRLPAAPD